MLPTPLNTPIDELLAMIAPDAKALGCVAEVEHAREIVQRGTSAHGQRRIYGEALDGLWDRYVAGQEALFDAGGDLYRALLAKVACPALVLHGAKDPLTPGLHAEAIHRGIAGSRLHIFPEGKHNIHIRYADEFNALVHAFLTEPDRS